jgi:hypothetical protein
MLEMWLASVHVAGTAIARGQAPEAEGFDGINLGDTQNLAVDPSGGPRLVTVHAEHSAGAPVRCVSRLPELANLHLDLVLLVEGREQAAPGELRRTHRRRAEVVLPARDAEAA